MMLELEVRDLVLGLVEFNVFFTATQFLIILIYEYTRFTTFLPNGILPLGTLQNLEGEFQSPGYFLK